MHKEQGRAQPKKDTARWPTTELLQGQTLIVVESDISFLSRDELETEVRRLRAQQDEVQAFRRAVRSTQVGSSQLLSEVES